MAIVRTVVNIAHSSVHGPAVNTWHLRWAGDGAGDALAQGLAALHDFYNGLTSLTAGGSSFSNDGNWEDVHTSEVFNEGGSFSTTTASSEPALPSPVALVVGWSTPTGGRSGKGRTFLSPLATSACASDGTPTATCLSVTRAAATALVAASAAIDAGALGVYSRKDDVIRDFTGSRVRNVFAVLTSRRD